MKWLHCRPVHLPIQCRPWGGKFITMIPGEQGHPKLWIVADCVPVGNQSMENSHPLPMTDSYAPSHTKLFAPARAESEPCHHPYTAFVRRQGSELCVAACHFEVHSSDWPSESARLIVRARQGISLLRAGTRRRAETCENEQGVSGRRVPGALTFRREFLLSTFHTPIFRARRLNPHGLLAFAMRAVSTTFAAATRASAILIISNTSILVDLLTRTRHLVASLGPN